MPKAGHVKRGIRVLLAGLAGQHARELEAILDGCRPRIIRAESCLDAWKRLHESAFDALIVDKGADGGWRDLIAETTAMGLALPVIVVSAKADERLWVDALSAGAYDALEIPFHRGETRRVLLTAVQGGDRGAAHIRRRACHVGSFGRRAAAMAAAAVLPA